MGFRLVQEPAADGFDVAVARRVLGVSRSGFYEVRDWPPSARDLADAHLANTIVDIHRDCRCCYGSPRVHAELQLGLGVRVGLKRVARLLRMAGRRGIRHRHKRRGHRPEPAVHADLVQRKFTAAAPDLLWCTDILEHPTQAGKIYCCAVLDVFTRQVAERVLVLQHVRAAEYGSTERIIDRPHHPHAQLSRVTVPGPGWPPTSGSESGPGHHSRGHTHPETMTG